MRRTGFAAWLWAAALPLTAGVTAAAPGDPPAAPVPPAAAPAAPASKPEVPPPAADGKEAPKWHGELAAAKAEAAAANRRILAVVTAGWYPSEPSRRLAEAVADPDAAPALEGFALLRVTEDATLPLSTPLGLVDEGHPYTALLESDGTVVASLRGAWPAARWAEDVRTLAAAADTRAAAAARVAATPTDLRARWDLSEALRALGRSAEADAELGRAEALDPEGRSPLQAEFRFRRTEARYEDRMAVQDFAGALALLDAYEKDFPNGPRRRWVAVYRALGLAYSGDIDGALADLATLAADGRDPALQRLAADRRAAVERIRDARAAQK